MVVLICGLYMTMIRSKNHKLVHFLGSEEGQLFDLKDDPQEVANLWDDRAYREEKRKLLYNLLEWRTQSALDTKNVFQACR